jgi:hypothetical protein
MPHFRNILLAIILVVTVPLVLVTGCKGSGFVTYTQKAGPAHFSFEYPSTYKVYSSDVSDAQIQLAFTDNTTSSQEPSQQTWLKIDVFPVDAGTPDAATAFENEASAVGLLAADIHTIEQLSTIVVGVQGNGVAMQYRLEEDSPPIVVRLIYFSKSGMIYGVHVGSNPENAEGSKAAFDNLLKTFKILD